MPLNTRREFLRRSAVIGAGLSLAGAHAAPACSPADKISVACIGVRGRTMLHRSGSGRSTCRCAPGLWPLHAGHRPRL